MNNTFNLQLPLLQASQAQKHVTVNRSLTMIDALIQMNVASSKLVAPPEVAMEGECYIVPVAAIGDWAGHAQEIAVWVNGGWIFHEPRAGWVAWDSSTGSQMSFDGVGWIDGSLSFSASGAATVHRVMEFDHMIEFGPTNTTAPVIPAGSQVTGVSGRVQGEITGPGLTTWRLGVSESDNRYGAGLGTAINSHVTGLTGTPVSYFSETSLLISSEGGQFASGEIKIAIHLTTIVPPREF